MSVAVGGAQALARLLLLAALPALAGWNACAQGEVVSIAGTGGAGVRGAYGAGGAGGVSGARFPPQRTTVVGRAGGDAALHCRLLDIGDKAVSWVRSRDLQILTHAGTVFTGDARVKTALKGGARGESRHTLRVSSLRVGDAGRYECQLNTEPKMSLFFNLTVAEGAAPRLVAVADREPAVGGATLRCEARYEPPPDDQRPLDIRWLKDGSPIDLQSGRGGVSLDTQRWPGRAVSRLSLRSLTAADAGRYTCHAAAQDPDGDVDVDVDVDSAQADVVVDVDDAENQMQRDEALTAASAAHAVHAAQAAYAARAVYAALPTLLALWDVLR